MTNEDKYLLDDWDDESVPCAYCGKFFNDGGGFYCCVECEEASDENW